MPAIVLLVRNDVSNGLSAAWLPSCCHAPQGGCQASGLKPFERVQETSFQRVAHNRDLRPIGQSSQTVSNLLRPSTPCRPCLTADLENVAQRLREPSAHVRLLRELMQIHLAGCRKARPQCRVVESRKSRNEGLHRHGMAEAVLRARSCGGRSRWRCARRRVWLRPRGTSCARLRDPSYGTGCDGGAGRAPSVRMRLATWFRTVVMLIPRVCAISRVDLPSANSASTSNCRPVSSVRLLVLRTGTPLATDWLTPNTPTAAPPPNTGTAHTSMRSVRPSGSFALREKSAASPFHRISPSRASTSLPASRSTTLPTFRPARSPYVLRAAGFCQRITPLHDRPESPVA